MNAYDGFAVTTNLDVDDAFLMPGLDAVSAIGELDEPLGGAEAWDRSSPNGFSVSEPRPAPPLSPPAQHRDVVDDALVAALEEADFFASQCLFDEALSTLAELIPRYPGHPRLIERMQFVRAAMRKAGKNA